MVFYLIVHPIILSESNESCEEHVPPTSDNIELNEDKFAENKETGKSVVEVDSVKNGVENSENEADDSNNVAETVAKVPIQLQSAPINKNTGNKNKKKNKKNSKNSSQDSNVEDVNDKEKGRSDVSIKV